MASNWQALTQEPKPRQPKPQAEGPLPGTTAALQQSPVPKYTQSFSVLPSTPPQRTKAAIGSAASAFTPMMAAIFSATGAPPAAHLLRAHDPAAQAAA